MLVKPAVLLATGSLALLLSAGLALADPGNGKSNQGKGKSGQDASSQQQPSQTGKGKKATHSNNDDYDDDDFQRRYDDDLDDIRRIFSRNSDSYGQAQALPPGIRKNLARGKSLPPGIAKKLDPSFARQLPNYPGYEWQQVGTDAALVNITSGIVREVLNDVLR